MKEATAPSPAAQAAIAPASMTLEEKVDLILAELRDIKSREEKLDLILAELRDIKSRLPA